MVLNPISTRNLSASSNVWTTKGKTMPKDKAKANLKKMKGKPGGYGKTDRFKGTKTEKIYSDMAYAEGQRKPKSAEKSGTGMIGGRQRAMQSIEDYRDKKKKKK